jgi:hypothetical protein
MASSAVNATFDSVLGSGTIDLAGTGVATGALGQNEINSIVSAYQVVVVDPDEAIGSECEPDDYCVNPDAADIQYLGIANNYAATDPIAGYTYFAITTYADWYTLHALAFNIYLDGDQDGEAEFMIFNDSPFQNPNDTTDAHNVMIQDLTGILGGEVNDIYVCGDTVNGVNGTVNTYVFNNNVVMLPVCTEDIFSNVVEDSSAAFDYWIETKAFQDYGILPEDSALVVDTVGPLSYDPENATYNFTGSLLGTAYADVNGGSISFDYNFTNPVSEVQKDILLLHHHNAGSVGRAEIVNVPLVVPDDFLLLSPGNGEVITDTSAFTAITWEPAANALTYRIVVIKVSNNTATSLVSRSAVGPVLDITLTGETDADALICDTGVCTLAVSTEVQALLSDGTYSWTVFASGGAASAEASNAPYTFKVNTGDIELLLNEDFENLDAEDKPDVTPWVVKNGAGDKGKCNKDKDGDGIPDKIVANTGNCAFQFKGSPGENSKLTQAVEDNPLFAQLGLGAGDVLNASIFVNTEIATPGKLQIKVKYVDPTAGAGANGKDKLNIDLAATVGYEQVTGSLTLADEVTKVGFSVKFSGQSGKMYVDDASLIRAAATSATRTGLGGRNGLVPVPPSSNEQRNSNGLNGKQ